MSRNEQINETLYGALITRQEHFSPTTMKIYFAIIEIILENLRVYSLAQEYI